MSTEGMDDRIRSWITLWCFVTATSKRYASSMQKVGSKLSRTSRSDAKSRFKLTIDLISKPDAMSNALRRADAQGPSIASGTLKKGTINNTGPGVNI